jgi:hypothetical protein
MSEELDIRKRIEECLDGPRVGKDLAYLTEVVYYKIKEANSLEEKLDWLRLRIKLFEKSHTLSGHYLFLLKALFAPTQLLCEYGHRQDIDVLNMNELSKIFLSIISHLNYNEVKAIGSSWRNLDNSGIKELAFLRNAVTQMNYLRDLLTFVDSDLREEVMKWLELKGKILQ